ncbi:MAG: hypothetical protein JW760_00625 [Spirochaetales bacterium]|nr:hypothetical protein [Spirochaetales bacterium]
MGNVEISLETSDGTILRNPTEGQIAAALNRFGKDLDHCNFTYGDAFLSAYGDARTGIFLTYTDSAGREFSSDDSLGPEEVTRIFLNAAEGKEDWKSTVNFKQEVSGPSQSAATPSSGAGKNINGNKTLKEELLDSVKNQAIRGLGRLAEKGVRGLFRK